MSLNDLNIKDKAVKSVLKTILKFKMLDSGDSILVSISGGPDSVFLTSVLNLIKDDSNLKLYCFHLDHKTRDGQSKKDAEFIKGFCNQLGIKLFKEEIDAKKWSIENKLSFQEGARKLRNKFLESIASGHEIKKIAVGHDADDNIETFFIHLIRGSGLKGLAGIKPKKGKFIRPLIETSRKEILNSLEKNSIRYCKDRTNLENIYFRNKIRNLLVPFIEQNLSKNFKKKLQNTIQILSDENDFIGNIAEKTIRRIATFKKNPEGDRIDTIEVPIKKLQAYPDAFKKRILLSAIEKVKGNLENIKSANINDILKTCFPGGERKELLFTENLKFVKEADKIFLLYEKSSAATGQAPKEYIIPKEYIFNPGEKQKYRELGIEVFSEVFNGNIDYIKKQLVSGLEVYLDYDKIVPPVKVKTWESGKGEKFFPLGVKGSKKLHDFFIDEKIPQSERDKIPIFFDGEKIIWVGKYRIDERSKVDSNTRKILHIKIFDI